MQGLSVLLFMFWAASETDKGFPWSPRKKPTRKELVLFHDYAVVFWLTCLHTLGLWRR